MIFLTYTPSGFFPPMLVLDKTYASQLAPQHTQPSGLMTNGEKPQHSYQVKNKSTSIKIVVGHKTRRRQFMNLKVVQLTLAYMPPTGADVRLSKVALAYLCQIGLLQTKTNKP